MDPHFDGVIFQTHAAELARRRRRPFPPFLILDVRGPEPHAAGHVPGAVPASPEELEQGRPAGASPHTEMFLVGAGPADPAVRRASLALMRHGAHRVVEFPGGMLEWEEAGYEVERGDPPARAA